MPIRIYSILFYFISIPFFIFASPLMGNIAMQIQTLYITCTNDDEESKAMENNKIKKNYFSIWRGDVLDIVLCTQNSVVNININYSNVEATPNNLSFNK